MPSFQYKAVTAGGDVVEGRMEAESRQAVVRRLQAQGQIPIRAEELALGLAAGRAPRARGGARRVSRRQLGVLTLELATLLEAGLPLERALSVLAELAESEALHTLIARMRTAVREGKDLSEAMAAEPDVFFPLYVNLVRAGEASGALDQALARLTEFMDRSRELRDALIQALTYPAILLAVSLASLLVILAVVVPRFEVLFEDAGARLPWITEVVVALARGVQRYWWALLALLAGLVLAGRRALADPQLRLGIDRTVLRAPVIGGLVARLEVARFARALGTLLTNGVTLLEALNIARQIIANRHVAAALGRVAGNVREGQGVARPLMREAVFPELACHMVQVGEETGQLDTMLLRLADIYDREVRTSVARAVTVLEPAIILTLGFLVAGIILSVLLAILRINEIAF